MELDPDSPAARVNVSGMHTATPFDLLAVVLSREARDTPLNSLPAASLVKRYGIAGLGDMGAADLREVSGLEWFESMRVMAAIELGRRSALARKGEQPTVTQPQQVWRLFANLANEKQEHFCAALLDSKGHLIGRPTIHIGTINSSLVGPREVFRPAVQAGAASVILVHNHPSGNPEPSPEDIEITRKLKRVGDLLDIPVLDHVIIGHDPEYVSLHDRGLM